MYNRSLDYIYQCAFSFNISGWLWANAMSSLVPLLLCLWGLALWALAQSRLLFPVRPKMHSLEHMLLGMPYIRAWCEVCWLIAWHAWGKPSAWIKDTGLCAFKGEPKILPMSSGRRHDTQSALAACIHAMVHASCFKVSLATAFFIKVKAIVQYIHPNVFASRALQHYCVAICMRWVRGVHTRDMDSWRGKEYAWPVLGFCVFSRFFHPSGLMLTHLFSARPLLTHGDIWGDMRGMAQDLGSYVAKGVYVARSQHKGSMWHPNLCW